MKIIIKKKIPLIQRIRGNSLVVVFTDCNPAPLLIKIFYFYYTKERKKYTAWRWLYLQTMLENKVIPQELRERKQWALSHNKAPYQTNGERASSTDERTWTSYEDAINKSDNVGYFIS